jgi:hypothetical protein
MNILLSSPWRGESKKDRGELRGKGGSKERKRRELGEEKEGVRRGKGGSQERNRR